MIPSIYVGQLEILSNCDLVSVLHREPKMHPAHHTFMGDFESKSHWTHLTPAKARELAGALTTIASQLDAISAAKASAVSSHQSSTEAR